MNSNSSENPAIDQAVEGPPTSTSAATTNRKRMRAAEYSSTLFQHIQEIVENGEVRYKCTLCDKPSTFKTKRNRLYHKYCLPGMEKPFKCDVPACKGKAFITKTHLCYHESQHKNDGRHSCHCCSRQFIQKSKLTRHLVTHTREMPHQCQECKKVFRNKCNLNSHAWTHFPPNSFECPVCKRTFNSPMNMRKHIKRLHTPCTKSTQKCKIKCTNEKCEQVFHSKWEMKEHRKIHGDGDIRPFLCEICSKDFMMYKDLVRHQRVHTGERPFKCFHCGNMHQRKDNLLRHLKNVHKEQHEVAAKLAREAEKEITARPSDDTVITNDSDMTIESSVFACNEGKSSLGKSPCPDEDIVDAAEKNWAIEATVVHENIMQEQEYPNFEKRLVATSATSPLAMNNFAEEVIVDKLSNCDGGCESMMRNCTGHLIGVTQQVIHNLIEEVYIETGELSGENALSNDEEALTVLTNNQKGLLAISAGDTEIANKQLGPCNTIMEDGADHVTVLHTGVSLDEGCGSSDLSTGIIESFIARHVTMSMAISMEDIATAVATKENNPATEIDLDSGSATKNAYINFTLKNSTASDQEFSYSNSAEDSSNDSIPGMNDQNSDNNSCLSYYSSEDDQLIPVGIKRHDNGDKPLEGCLNLIMYVESEEMSPSNDGQCIRLDI